MPSSKDMWNELCEDAECEDTNYHSTVEELLERIHSTSSEIKALGDTENIIEAEYKRWRQGR